MSNLRILVAIGFVCLSGAVLPAAAGNDRYDELFDDEGEVRPVYSEVWRVYSRIPGKKRERLKRRSVKAFNGDNALLPLPRLIERDEFDGVLRKGIEQRATALRLFLQDYYSGKRRAIKAGIVPSEVVARALRRSGEADAMGYVNPDTISFWYGPDTIRDEKGRHRMVEDNPGYIGGIGDLKVAQQALFSAVPGYRDLVNAPDPAQFYRKVVERYRARANPPNGQLVLLLYDKNHASDGEEARIAANFEAEGVTVVRLNSHNPNDQRLTKRLVTTKKGVWLERRNAGGGVTRTRVGLVMACMEPFDVDPKSPAVRRQVVLRQARELLEDIDEDESAEPKEREKADKLRALVEADLPDAVETFIRANWKADEHSLDAVGVPGLFEAIADGRVAANVTPGTDFIGDKELYMYVDKLIEFYLHEKPLVPNIASSSFSKDGELDARLLGRVFGNLEKFVIKKVDGRGGSEVWIGPKLKGKKSVEALKERIREHPENFIAQRYTSISVFDNHIVDIRVISDVGPKDVQVSETPWGRAAPVRGDGKVNLSQRGSETAVLVVDRPGHCEQGPTEALFAEP